jgi:hypothetical protein
MNARRFSYYSLGVLFATILMLLAACQQVNNFTSLPTVQPTATMLPVQDPTATQPSAQATRPASGTPSDFTLDITGVAQNVTVETVAAVPASAGGPSLEVMPQYRRVDLQSYPVANHRMKPQIFIFPAGDLASANENAGKAAADLQALLQSRQAGDKLPFLPLDNNLQVMHAKVEYLDFKNGKGVVFLTQYNNGIVPINNMQLIYTFQGLTSDGKTYIAAVLPVTHPDLPPTDQASSVAGAEFQASLAKTITWLEQQPGGSFTPDLAKLNAMIQSIEVK